MFPELLLSELCVHCHDINALISQRNLNFKYLVLAFLWGELVDMENGMKGCIVVCVAALALAGCSEPAETTKSPVSQEKPAQITAPTPDKNQSSIYFVDGTGVSFSGKVIREEKLENSKGNFQRHVLQVPTELMFLESSTFAVLAKSGYTRKVRREEPPLFTVNYIKKGFPTVLAAYKELVPGKDGVSRTQLVLTWRVEE